MPISKCTHVRVRDEENYNLNIEALLKYIENKCDLDIKSLPRWQELVKRLHVAQTDYKRRIQYADYQKAQIINKLYIQSSRLSPFELTELLARTTNKWKAKKKPEKISLLPSVHLEDTRDETPKLSLEQNSFVEETELPHPNTENVSLSSFKIEKPLTQDVEAQYSRVSLVQQPAFIVTNSHRLISPLGSRYSRLNCQITSLHDEILGETQKEWKPFTDRIICKPATITITPGAVQQSLQFSLTNCTTEYLHIRFKYVTDPAPFHTTKILPVIPKRLYPGVAVVYKFIYKLKTEGPFTSGLYFRVGRDVYADAPTLPFFIPIATEFASEINVSVTDTVTIPSVYPWHINMGLGGEPKFPTGYINISNDNHHPYHIHIYRRDIGSLLKEDEHSITDTSHTENHENKASFITAGPATNEVLDMSKFDINIILEHTFEDIVLDMLQDIVQCALNAIVLDSTYKYLLPRSKIKIPVFLTKAEHIGYHQCCYDVDIMDIETNRVIERKTIKVYAEVLPHPVQITPLILDMSDTPVHHGYCIDQFMICNNHKQYNVTACIKLTTKMMKIFHLDPMKCMIGPGSSEVFKIRLCCKEQIIPQDTEFVHFTVKIILTGHKSVYQNVPPIFYEMIMPCSLPEFKKVYNEKYFKDLEEL